MSASKDDDDYWYGSDKLAFSFDNNEVEKLFQASKIGTARLQEFSVLDESRPNAEDTQKVLKPLHSIISEKALACILAADKVLQLPQEPTLVQADVTLQRILLGQPYFLEQYKSLASKTSLLDAAIKSGDGNAILIIIIFVTKTLKQSLVQKLLTERPEALACYTRYLSSRYQLEDIADLYTMQGCLVDAAMKSLHIIIKNTEDMERLLQKLRNCYKTQFQMVTQYRESHYALCYIKLLEWQLSVKEIEYKDPIQPNCSVLDCLRFSCKDFWHSSEGTIVSPAHLVKQHQVSQRQFHKVALNIRASVQDWDNIDHLLFTKGWLGSKKLLTHLSIEEILKILHEQQAPSNILEKYLKYVDNVEKRLEIAKKLQCYKTVVDAYVAQGDRTALAKYKTDLPMQSEQYFYAESALRSSTTKWKN